MMIKCIYFLYFLIKDDLRHRVKQARSLAHSGWLASNPAPHSWSLAAAQVGQPLQISVVVSPLSQHFGIYIEKVNYTKNDAFDENESMVLSIVLNITLPFKNLTSQGLVCRNSGGAQLNESTPTWNDDRRQKTDITHNFIFLQLISITL